MKPLLILGILSLFVAGCATGGGFAATPQAEAEVWAALIRGMNLPGERVVLRSVTESQLHEPEDREFEGVPDALVRRLAALPDRPTGDPAIGRPTTLVSPEELEAIFADSTMEGWKAFQRRWPDANGYVTVSRVAFSDDGETALVSCSHVFGALGGAGTLVLLVHDGDGWRIAERIGLWVS